MPARHLMTWEPNPRRWKKTHKGTRYVVSVRQLEEHFNTPIDHTKEASYQWANRWWEEQSRSTPTVRTKPTIRLETHDFETGEPTGEFLDFTKDEIDYQRNRQKQLIDGVRAVMNPPEIPKDRTIGHLATAFLGLFKSRLDAKQISVSEYSNARAGLEYFTKVHNKETPVDKIDEPLWERFYTHLLTSEPKSTTSKRKHFRYAKNFITWLDNNAIIHAPKNLNRRYAFKAQAEEIETLSIVQVKKTVAQLKGQLRLHVRLMLNCGFTQQDVSDLHPSEVDWMGGRIRRKRSKTGNHKQVPTVDYVLWGETFNLLKQYRSEDENHVLLTESKKAWLRDTINPDGGRTRTDAIQSIYRKTCPTFALKLFRKTSSSLLNNHPVHGKYAPFFLGHAETIAHKHYLNQNGEGFDDAVRWLGEQYGL